MMLLVSVETFGSVKESDIGSNPIRRHFQFRRVPKYKATGKGGLTSRTRVGVATLLGSNPSILRIFCVGQVTVMCKGVWR